ncbi:MAG: ABC transporter permease, partial [Anaerolineae bacterium]
MAEPEVLPEEITEVKVKTRSFWRSFLRSRAGVLGLIMLVSMVLIAVFAPWIAPYDPYEPVQATAEDVMAPPSAEHLLGTDESGR